MRSGLSVGGCARAAILVVMTLGAVGYGIATGTPPAGPPTGLKVLKAEWGTAGRTIDLTSAVAEALASGGWAEPQHLSPTDPAPGAYKTLSVTFAAGERTIVLRADEAYGGFSLAEVPLPGRPAAEVRVTSAEWGVDRRRVDVTRAVAALIDAGRPANQVPDTLGQSDPAYGVNKMVLVRCRVDGLPIEFATEALTARVLLRPDAGQAVTTAELASDAPAAPAAGHPDGRVNPASVSRFRSDAVARLDTDVRDLMGPTGRRAELEGQLRDARKQLYQSRDAEQKRDLQATVRQLNGQVTDVETQAKADRVARAEWVSLSDDKVASRLTLALAEQDRQTAVAAAAAAERDREAASQAEANRAAVAVSREAKWPGYHGPWMACPVCGGTGRDQLAEQRLNARNASIALSQMGGSGGMGHLPGAVVACPTCGGAGEIPSDR